MTSNRSTISYARIVSGGTSTTASVTPISNVQHNDTKYEQRGSVTPAINNVAHQRRDTKYEQRASVTPAINNVGHQRRDTKDGQRASVTPAINNVAHQRRDTKDGQRASVTPAINNVAHQRRDNKDEQRASVTPAINNVAHQRRDTKDGQRGRKEPTPGPLTVHRRQWEKQQDDMKRHLIVTDCQEVRSLLNARRGALVAGVDISFIKGDEVNACVALTIMDFPQMKVVYVDTLMVRLTAPYIAGFLGFREVPHFLTMLRRLKATKPHLTPNVILVDGNGALHPKGFGSACQLGVQSGIPCIGVGKKLHHVDGIGADFDRKAHTLKKTGDCFPLVGRTSRSVLGMAVLTPRARRDEPVFVSVGHKVSLNTAVQIVLRCCQCRIPEPINLADRKSRQYIRNNW